MMTDNIQNIRTLIDRFYDGDTTLSEEQELYTFFRHAHHLPDDLEAQRSMFLAYDALPSSASQSLPSAASQFLPSSVSQSLPSSASVPSVALPTQQTEHPAARRWPYWAAAAAIALMLVGGASLLFRRSPLPVSNDDEELVAYIYGQRTTDPDVVLAEMNATMIAMQGDGMDVVEQQLKDIFEY